MREVTGRSDQELVQRCLKGDEEAWSLLIRRYERLVYSVARVLCPDAEDSADVFQYTCLDLYKGLSDIQDIRALPAWLMTVARRRAINVLKARKPTAEPDEETPATFDALRAIEREHLIERALEQLTDRCRGLINLLYFHIDQPSYADIGQRLGIPVSSIGPTRARCLEKLRKLLT